MWRRHSHWDEMMRLQEEMDRLFNTFWDPSERQMIEDRSHSDGVLGYRHAICNLDENEKELVTRIEMPGIDKKDIKINVTEDGIEVKAEKKEEMKKGDKKDKSYHFMRSYSGFYRAFALPRNVDKDKIDAEYKDGILTLRIPKKEIEEKKKKLIEVK